MTCTTKSSSKQTLRKQAYTRYHLKNSLLCIEKKVKYGLEPELLIQLAIRQWSNIRALGHYTTEFACDPAMQESNTLHLTEGRKRLFAMTTPQGLQRQLFTFYIKIGIGNQPAVPGEVQCGKSKPRARPRRAVFSLRLLPALLKPRASSAVGPVSAEAGWCAGFRHVHQTPFYL